MKSKRAKDYITTICLPQLLMYDDEYGEYELKLKDAKHAVDLAEEDMADKACRLFEQFMSGVFQGDTPKKMAQEFKQKLME